MTCHICKAEAVTRCYTCGELVCEEHGKQQNCPLCSTGFTAADPRAVSTTPLPKEPHKGWWRPQEAAEFKPNSCYECKGLARAVCRNCQSNYCAEHAGGNGLCKSCQSSANLGLYVMAGVFLLIGLLFALQWLFA
jgi:hypothetical protein